MGWSDSGARCRKHTRQHNSPGVCPFCLREKLSRLTSSNTTAATTATSSCSSSSSISSCSSCSDSSYSSPSHHLSSGANGRISFLVGPHGGFFTRSRTVAFTAPNRARDAAFVTEGKKKGGFWSKLLRPSGKTRKEVFLHSQTMKNIHTNYVYTR
ncbi:uncharacterized protein LOC131242358 [Magnolia sinica]|uniref:uncharacterized protein LOC131242358 n=1 Tax=Magnolia sinica TaxID=86752 RepID=UPI0026595231|nr:uncharacterized protein LOC131242358 [Magnolia sinica]